MNKRDKLIDDLMRDISIQDWFDIFPDIVKDFWESVSSNLASSSDKELKKIRGKYLKKK